MYYLVSSVSISDCSLEHYRTLDLAAHAGGDGDHDAEDGDALDGDYDELDYNKDN